MKLPTIKNQNLIRGILFLLAILICIYYGLYSRFEAPFHLSSALRGSSDRNLHIIALASMTLIFMIGQKKHLMCLLIMVGLAITLEAAQVWFPLRTASWKDLLSSLIGVGLGGCLAMLANHFLEKNKESDAP